jgi:hypothetical protein
VQQVKNTSSQANTQLKFTILNWICKVFGKNGLQSELRFAYHPRSPSWGRHRASVLGKEAGSHNPHSRGSITDDHHHPIAKIEINGSINLYIFLLNFMIFYFFFGPNKERIIEFTLILVCEE